MAAFVASGSLLGDLGREYIAPWVGELISAGAAISAFGACAAVLVGASRLLFAVSRDSPRSRGLAFTDLTRVACGPKGVRSRPASVEESGR